MQNALAGEKARKYPRPCLMFGFERDPFTMGLILCNDDGMVRTGLFSRDDAPYPCTGHAHYMGQHIECLSPAHGVK